VLILVLTQVLLVYQVTSKRPQANKAALFALPVSIAHLVVCRLQLHAQNNSFASQVAYHQFFVPMDTFALLQLQALNKHPRFALQVNSVYRV